MGIGIDRYYHVYDNTTYYRDYWADAVSPPPENATNVKECGCYIVEEKGMGNIHYIWNLPLSLQKSHE